MPQFGKEETKKVTVIEDILKEQDERDIALQDAKDKEKKRKPVFATVTKNNVIRDTVVAYNYEHHEAVRNQRGEVELWWFDSPTGEHFEFINKPVVQGLDKYQDVLPEFVAENLATKYPEMYCIVGKTTEPYSRKRRISKPPTIRKRIAGRHQEEIEDPEERNDLEIIGQRSFTPKRVLNVDNAKPIVTTKQKTAAKPKGKAKTGKKVSVSDKTQPEFENGEEITDDVL